jgi:hypothetical protein
MMWRLLVLWWMVFIVLAPFVRYIGVTLLWLMMHWIDVVHIAPLRLVNCFVWTLLLAHIVLLGIQGLLLWNSSSLSRSWSLFRLLHCLLLWYILRVHLWDTTIDICSVRSLLHHSISRSHLAPTVWILWHAWTRCLWSLLRRVHGLLDLACGILWGSCSYLLMWLYRIVWITYDRVYRLFSSIDSISLIVICSFLRLWSTLCLFQILGPHHIILCFSVISNFLVFAPNIIWWMRIVIICWLISRWVLAAVNRWFNWRLLFIGVIYKAWHIQVCSWVLSSTYLIAGMLLRSL